MCSHPANSSGDTWSVTSLDRRKDRLGQAGIGAYQPSAFQPHPRRKLFQSCQRVDELSATLHRLAKSGMEGKQTSALSKTWNYRVPIKSLANSRTDLPGWWSGSTRSRPSVSMRIVLISKNNLINCNYSHRTTCCREVTLQATSTPEIVRDVSKLEVGQKLATRLTRGTVISTVEELDD